MALIDNSTFLIYKLLNHLSNILNRFLQKYGIKNDHNVMIIHVLFTNLVDLQKNTKSEINCAYVSISK